MARIASVDDIADKKIEREVQLTTRGKTSLEEAARAYSSLIYESFEESVVLTRLFATVPFGALPAARASFVSSLAAANALSDKIDDDTLVLSLLGTRGLEPDWNTAMASRGHIGIPLASAAFVEAIPMVSRLLHQIGAGVDWIDRKDTAIVARTLGMLGGVFYVERAESETDIRGRKVIAAQDFVKKYGIKTVFGFGGGYAGTQVFVVAIHFLRELIDKRTAERFLGHVDRLKVSTADLVTRNQLFETPS